MKPTEDESRQPAPSAPEYRPGVAKQQHYRLLDSVRAVAALMVVAYHVQSPEPAADGAWDVGDVMNVGVAVFFVLSGFLLYRPFLRARLNGAPRPSFRRYLTRRFLRVVPGYWLAITVFGLTLPLLVPVLGSDWWIFYSLTQTWVPGRMFDGLAPAWSLSVEMSFYLALPLYVLAVARLVGHRPVRQQVRVEAALLILLAVITLAARRLVFDRGEGPLGFLVWSIAGHVDWFAAGLGLAMASVLWGGAAERPRLLRVIETRPTSCWAVAGVLIALLGFLRGSPGDVVHLLSLPIAVLMVAPAVFGDGSSGPIRRLLGTRPMLWLGTVSYGIFLWNEPLATVFNTWFDFGTGSDLGFLVGFVATTAVAVAAGAASYYLVERPSMSLTRLIPDRTRPDARHPERLSTRSP